MSEEVIKILDDLCKRFGIAIDWSSENIVPYLEQLCKKYINYEIVTSVIWIILFATGFIIICKTYSIIVDKIDYEILPILVLILLGVVIIWQVLDIATCLTFPEKIILESIKRYTSLST